MRIDKVFNLLTASTNGPGASISHMVDLTIGSNVSEQEGFKETKSIIVENLVDKLEILI